MGLCCRLTRALGLIAAIAVLKVDLQRTFEKLEAFPLSGPLVNFKQKIVHLDLKGAPLSIAYMESVFPLVRQMGATGLLIEYEDMFPYSGPLVNFTARNHYSPNDIKRLLAAAQANNLTVMPLVQTFGHLEFSLKLSENVGLREDPTNPQALCPSLNASVATVREMIRQVADLHQNHITHFHIGSDEVFVIGKCARCRRRLAVNDWTTDDLFLNHTLTVVRAVKELGLHPVMWDDMFRKVDLTKLAKYKALTSLVDIMVWQYSSSLSSGIVTALKKYTSLYFPGVWVASAFKGGVNPSNQMPAYELHLNNHIAWSVMAKHFEDRLNLSGIAITGWQRFDHFTPLCELFPVSIPVLSLCLAYLNTGSFGTTVLAAVQRQLKCDHPIPLNDFDPPLMSCSYPGSNVLVAIQQFDQIQRKRQSIEAGNYYKAAMSPMNRNHNFGSPLNVRGAIAQLPDMVRLSVQVQDNLQELQNVTDKATLREWTETYLDPEIAWIGETLAVGAGMLTCDSWPRRPLYDEN
ncbi:hexosaminidase D-like [Tropilaelaps mercedesae]|uniref:beta-N-acetylhexosaminidase n=1 Tax=Tropilaelaps mercedesae TaxID=418985 RepID=A0A1V9XV14_9ACAR|nr:hexosaminidase D-like [Tropilaelaps mercedesae]